MAYFINTENTGLTEAEVEKMAQLMQADGYDVETTRNFGLINPEAECPVSEHEWEQYLELVEE